MVYKYKNPYRTYITGSVKGIVLGDKEAYAPRKVTYIKINKGGRVYYLGDNKLVKKMDEAKYYSDSQQANKIVMNIRKNSRYVNYAVYPVETSYIPSHK